MLTVVLALIFALVCAGPASAQTGSGTSEPSTYDRIWKFAQWFKSESNPAVQEVLFTGRFQEDFAALDADQGDRSEWNVRRFRVGPRIRFMNTFTFHAEVELNPQEHDPLYVRFTDLYVQWRQSDRVTLTVGKQSVPFTLEGATSSKELLTIDRSNLSNNLWFPQEYIPGASVSGRRAEWVYRAGVYSAGAQNREFGRFNGSLFGLGVIGYNFGPRLGVKEALLSANYVYQPADASNTFTRQLDHVASVNFRLDAGRWGLRTDVSGASGYLGQSDLWGVMAMPYVNATDKLQFVGRYTVVQSDAANGVRLATYENAIVPGRGDSYDEFYAGANYYFYGHKLKLQTGVLWADMDDVANDGGAYSGTSWVTGLRVGW
jgi:phosphate-selective porin OprO and OprP